MGFKMMKKQLNNKFFLRKLPIFTNRNLFYREKTSSFTLIINIFIAYNFIIGAHNLQYGKSVRGEDVVLIMGGGEERLAPYLHYSLTIC